MNLYLDGLNRKAQWLRYGSFALGECLAKKKKKDEDVESYRHEAETCKDAVPVGPASYNTAKPKPKKYDYDPPLTRKRWSEKKREACDG